MKAEKHVVIIGIPSSKDRGLILWSKPLITPIIMVMLGCNTVCLGQPELEYSGFAYSVGNEVCIGQRAEFFIDLTNVGTEATGHTDMSVRITPTGYFIDTVATLCTDSNYVPIEPGETGHFYCSGVIPDLEPGRYWFVIWFPWYEGEWYPGFPTNFRVCGGVGACCNWAGICTEETEVDCVFNMGRSYEGEGTECLGDWNGDGWDDACSNAPQTEACCWVNNTCTDELPSDCGHGGGWTQGPGTQCMGDLDGSGYDDSCEPMLACCGGDGSCFDAFSAQSCMDQGGYPKALGIMCNTPGVCDEDQDRACCWLDGYCQDLHWSSCAEFGGTPQAIGVMCSDAPCGPQCLGDLSGDGSVSLSDRMYIDSLLMQAGSPYRIYEGDPLWDANADLNGDGIISLADRMVIDGILMQVGPPYISSC